MRTRARPSRRAVAVTSTILALGIVACGGGDSTDASERSTTTESTPSSTEAETTTTAPVPPEDQAWADLEAAYAAFSAVAAAPDPDSPELARYYTGESLASVQQTMRDLKAGTGGSVNSVQLHRYSVSVVGDTATADYCFIDSSQHLDSAGNPVEAPELTSMRANSQMQHIDGVWKLAQQTFTPEECPAP
jgi:hypothetical protein